MSLGLIETQIDSQQLPIASATVVESAPFWWTSRGESLFGWLHTSRGIARSDHAVVIAAPIGYEQLHSHRSLRHLADELVRRGIPTLRFDWHGTGDSGGIDEDGDRLETWRANLRDAVALLKERLSISEVSIIGVRLGAALAATAFAADEIANLVLWAPVVSGKTYVREMTAIDRTSEIPAPPAEHGRADLEPAGFTLAQQTAQDIARINLLVTPPAASRVLIASRDDLPGNARLMAAWTAAKVRVEEIVVSGFPEMMAPPHKGDVPREAIRRICEWMEQQQSPFSTATGEKAPEGRKLEFSLQAATHRLKPELQRMPPLPRIGGEGTSIRTAIRERMVNLSHDSELFGILSEPSADVPEERPTIVLLNAGAAYRIGPGRLNVHLARRLATEGFRCLRLDSSGFGDSVAEDERRENRVYDATVFRDVDLTLRSLREQQLGRRFVVVGLCSGAYNAFQSAVSLADPSLIGSVLINPLTFFWRNGMEISESTDRQLLVEQWYFASACDPRKWLKLLSGARRSASAEPPACWPVGWD